MANPNQAQRNPQDNSNDQDQGIPKQAPQASDPQHGSQKHRVDGAQGKVGQDTDGDGKVVKPGQTPGQSHGRGLDPSGKTNTAEPARKMPNK